MNKAHHKSGYVNIMGNPNVGKSTLMNAFVGEKISIVTSKAQTTRHRILGIVNEPDYQIVFSDTPGIIKPIYNLQSSMMDFVKSAFDDADILIYMVEIEKDDVKDDVFFERVINAKVPVIVLINKIDTSNQKRLEEKVTYWKNKISNAEIHPISAIEKFNTDLVFRRIISLLPVAPPYFDKDALTDKPERFFVNETIREKLLLFLKKEVPYAAEVITESFENERDVLKIRSSIIVERDTQKGIVIGHLGNTLKKIGTAARKDLEVFFGKKIFLDLRVKVIKNWRRDDKHLLRFGYRDS